MWEKLLANWHRLGDTLFRWATFWGMIALGVSSTYLADEGRFPEAVYRLLWAYILHVIRQEMRRHLADQVKVEKEAKP